MRTVIQRVTQSAVSVSGKIVGEIEKGLLVLLGVENNDTERDAEYLANKIINLRVFEDENGKMNKSLVETGGQMLVVSQFTLYGDCQKGRRPSFIQAAEPEKAKHLYEHFADLVSKTGIRVESGRFQETMAVSLVNDGPVTLIIDSK
jgi:D-tyrosyl-tRNA(Tyr) deacylase